MTVWCLKTGALAAAPAFALWPGLLVPMWVTVLYALVGLPFFAFYLLRMSAPDTATAIDKAGARLFRTDGDELARRP
jgi:hypothetical protein